MTTIKESKYNSAVSDSNISVVGTNDSAGLEFLRNQIVKEYKKSVGYGNREWVTLEDEPLVKLILETFADDYKREIMYSTLYNPKTITEILDICKIPKTSGYRIINSMIENHLLVPKGRSRNGHRVLREYASTIENVQVETVRNKIIVRIKFVKSMK
ncbi:MAG: hypothetical protein ACRD92_06655 [Nitrosopumilaceae archaeon]